MAVTIQVGVLSNWVKSGLITLALIGIYNLLDYLSYWQITLINFTQASLVACALGYFYYKSGPVVKGSLFFPILFSFLFTLVYTYRLFGGDGEYGTRIANFVWIPVWFLPSYSFYKASKDLKNNLKADREMVDNALNDI